MKATKDNKIFYVEMFSCSQVL